MITEPYLQKLAQIESGNDPFAKNPKSTAKGRFQFIDATAKQYGISAEFGTPEYEEQEKRAVVQFTQDNFNLLKRSLRRNPSEGELYLAHQQGAEGARKLLSSPNAMAVEVLGKDEVINNGGNEDMTASEFADLWVKKFGDEEAPEIQFSREQILQELERRKSTGVNEEVQPAQPEIKFTRSQIQGELDRRSKQEKSPSFTQRVYQHALRREENIQRTTALAEDAGLPHAAFLPQVGEAVGFVGDASFETVATVSKAVAPELTKVIADVTGKVVGAAMNTPPARFISEEYGEFKGKHPLLAENIEGGLATALIVAPVTKTGQVTGKVNTSVKKSGDLIKKADDAVKEAIENAPKRDVLRIDQTERAIKNILRASNKSYDELLDKLKSSDILTIADLAGDEVQGLTRSLGKMDGAKNVIHGALTQRSEAAVTRVTSVLSEKISNVENYFGNIDELGKARAAAARPLYKKAFGEAVDIQDDRLAKFLSDKRIDDAMNTAKRSYGVRVETPANSLEALDGVKKVLYDLESRARRTGEANLANSFKGLRQDLVKVLDDASDSYKTARKVYETPSRLIDAQEKGILFNRLQPEQIRKLLSDLEPHEVEAYRIGVRQKLQEIVSKTSDGADPAKRVFGNDLKRKQLEAVFENKEHFQEFSKRMGDEIQGFKTRNAILGGSRSDYNLASDLGFIDAAADASRRGVLSVATDKIVEAVAGSVKAMYRGINKKNAETVAEILVDRDKGIKALQELLEKQKDFQQRATINQIIKNHGAISLYED